MKVHPTRLSHNWRPNFAFENYYVPPSFEFLGVILHKQHEWIKLWHQKKKSNCFCQNGCLCQIWLLCQEWVWARSNVDLWNAIFKYMSWRLKSLGMNFGIKLLFKAKDLVTTNDEKIFQFLHLISCITLHEKMHIIFAFISNSQLKHVYRVQISIRGRWWQRTLQWYIYMTIICLS